MSRINYWVGCFLSLNCLCALPSKSEAEPTSGKYNVLFIAVDDLNDWTGFMGGHPQTMTPHMDQLASEGLVFENAFCAASVCNPSRASLMTGYRPSTTGIYGNNQYMRDSEVLKDAETIPQYLSRHGYYTMARGKIFHHPNGKWADVESWDLHVNTEGSYGKAPEKEGFMSNEMPDGAVSSNFDWGPTDANFEDTPDYKNAKWAADMLREDYEKPFFLACGIFRPHLEWKVPNEFFEKFEESEMILPEVNEDDYNDIPDAAMSPSEDYLSTKKYNKQQAAVQAYLACINYADSCIGVLLDALAKSKYAENTVVILWGDHGWHLGEKLRYKKFTLWEEACRMPLIIKIPGMTNPGSRCERTVNLVDLYPTIVDLCKLPKNANNEGQSLVPLLYNPRMEWNYPSVTTMGRNRHSVRTEAWRYIQYEDGSRELYDHEKDPLEWDNVSEEKANLDKIEYLKSFLPKVNKEGVEPSKK